MKKQFWFVTVLILSATHPALAQEHAREPRTGYGYLYAAPGVSFAGGLPASMALGGGAEGLLKGGFGIGVDGGYLFFPHYGSNYGLGTVSPGVVYQFNNTRKTIPFVLGGYTLGFRSGVVNLVHFGGGINHWFTPKWGLRIETRCLLDPQYPQANALQFRVAVLID